MRLRKKEDSVGKHELAEERCSMGKHEFVWEEEPGGKLLFLGSKDDSARMNWIQGSKEWGTVRCPDGVEASVQRELLENGRLRETYRFTNVTSFPVFLNRTDLGIYATFNDNYEAAEECLERRCHTHLFCGLGASYVQAFRMGGRPPHLGLQLVKGSIGGYSVERDEGKRSEDRGDIILHPVIPVLEPGESAEEAWDLFWFEDAEDFECKLLEEPDSLYVRAGNCTFFPGEEMGFEVYMGHAARNASLPVIECNGEKAEYQVLEGRHGTAIRVSCGGQEEGEYRFRIRAGERETCVLLYRCRGLDEMLHRRCSFIAEKQQYCAAGSHLDGAYLIYDREEDKPYYSHRDDHNGGRERIGMGALLALWLQGHEDGKIHESLMRYREYVYRELFDRDTGVVYNDICRNNDWNRLYNYPWMAVFQLELYGLTGEREYLLDAFHVMEEYYRLGGNGFYGIGIPMTELLGRMEKEGMAQESQLLKEHFLGHADVIRQNGLHYPASEVAYEQSIVAPAVSILLQAEQLTGEGVYLREAERQMEVLELFGGRQPDYRQFANAIRHWDGYWFGKRRMYGDTFPHYWSVLSGVAYAQMYAVTGDAGYGRKASASFRGCLNLFMGDGSASCARVAPWQVNGKAADYYDPWANDQDWALYYALKYRELLEGSFDSRER